MPFAKGFGVGSLGFIRDLCLQGLGGSSCLFGVELTSSWSPAVFHMGLGSITGQLICHRVVG